MLPASLSALFCLESILFCLYMEWRVGLSVCFIFAIKQKCTYWVSNDSQFFQPRNYQEPYQNPKVEAFSIASEKIVRFTLLNSS